MGVRTMKIKDEMAYIEMMVTDLKDSVEEFDRIAKKIGEKWKPTQGYGSIGDSLSQGATSYAIERKIVTIRERLNTLRKRIVDYNYYKEK